MNDLHSPEIQLVRFRRRRAKHAQLSHALVGLRLLSHLYRTIQHRQMLRAMPSHRIESAAFDQRIERRSIHRPQVHPFAEIEQPGESASLVPLDHDLFDRFRANTFNRPQPEPDNT